MQKQKAMNYKTMTTKKLSALLSSVDEATAVEIQAIIDSRQQASDENESSPEIDKSDDEFIKTLDEVEKVDESKVQNRSTKMTQAECEELANELSKHVGYRAKVVPFNTIEWTECVIAGIIADKRSNRVLYALRCDDGRRIVKAHNSKMLIISDVKSDVPLRKGITKSSEPVVVDIEQLLLTAESLKHNVGRLIFFKPSKDYFVVRDSDNAIVELAKVPGTIVSIVPDKRSGRVLYRIKSVLTVYDQEGIATEDGRPAEKVLELYSHKVSTSSDIEYTETFDESVVGRMKTRTVVPTMSKMETVAYLTDAVEKARVQRERYDKLLTKRIEQLNAAIEDLNSSDATADETVDINVDETADTNANEDLN